VRKFKVPNISTLLAFEAAARHESFTRAAHELFVTESAISRQINVLESSLGVRLFVRVKQRVVLTRAGRLYSIQVRKSLGNLDRDTLSLIAHGSSGGHLELAVLPTFASDWLIPRLPDFNARVPGVRINMSVRTEMFPFEETHFEAAIHYGTPNWPGTTADYLFGEEVVPVCSSRLLTRPLRHPSDLLKYPLLHSTTRPDSWADWFANLGVEDQRTRQGVRYEVYTMLIRGAAAGLGVALVPRFFVESQLERLELVIPIEAPYVPESAYYLVYPTDMGNSRPLEQFRDWLVSQAEEFTSEPG
jgi:LysR family glycine cleavage system transcriptional activator